MKAIFKTLLTLSSVCLMGVTSCSTQGEANLLYAPEKTEKFDYKESETDNFKKLSESVKLFANKFSSKGYAKLKHEGNFVLSPISVYLALALASEVTEGNTQSEILNALNIDYQTLKSTYKFLFESLNKEYETGQTFVTNSVWLNTNLPFKDEALDSLAKDYYCYSYSADFVNNNEAANKAIEDFVSENTKGLINQDFNFSQDTLFVLLNTLYLKDTWLEFGDDLPYYEKEIDFVNSENKITTKKFLQGNYITGNIYEEESFDSFYTLTNNGYRLKFIVPNDGYSIGDVFTEDNIDKLTNMNLFSGIDEENKTIYKTRCIFPEFEATYNASLKDFVKEEFNINDLFTSKCDFTPLTDIEASCSDIIHVAKLKTDRKGIEGAAITVLDADTAFGDGLDYQIIKKDFFIDKAFGFVVEDSFGTNLFSGVIENI